MAVMAVVALREMRDKIRALGLKPPGLPPEFKWLDEPGA